MALKTLTNITDTQLKAYGVSALATRPNAPSTYGAGGLSAEELKARFDNLGKMLAKAINDINTALSTDGASYIGLEIGEEIKSLADLSSSYLDGTFANVLKAYEKATDIGDTEKLKTLQTILSGFSQRLAEVEVGDTTTLEQANAYTDTQDTAKLAEAKTYADTQDTTNLANAKAYADTKIAELIDSAPATFDTLKEIADWIESGHYGQGASLRNMGAWATATSYSANAEYIDIVVYENTAYLCKLSHTSSASILPTNTTYWEMISNGVVSATISGMDITFTFADGTTQTLEIQTETAEATEITIDSVPTNNSTNLVTSGGVKTELDKKQNTLIFDTAPTSGSNNIVTSGGVKTELDKKQNTLIFDSTPISGSVKPITSGGVYNSTYRKVYKFISEIQGITTESTISDIVTAMGALSVFISDMYMPTYPNIITGLGTTKFGTLQIVVDGNGNAALTLSTKPINSTTTEYYTSQYRKTDASNNWSGWKLMVDNDMPLLWTGTWSSGNLTVTGISNYKMVAVRLVDEMAPIILTRLRETIRFTGGGIAFADNVGQHSAYAEFTISGDVLTFVFTRKLGHTADGGHGGVDSSAAIISIWGIM